MARKGQNPLKWIKQKEKPNDITITSIVHLPELAGFWMDGLKVLDKFFYSIRKNTGLPFDLMILDNVLYESFTYELLIYKCIESLFKKK